MKTRIFILALALIAMLTFQSCATVLGGSVSQCQKTKPTAGQPQRKVRVGYLIADILLAPVISLPTDFITGAIYKPCKK